MFTFIVECVYITFRQIARDFVRLAKYESTCHSREEEIKVNAFQFNSEKLKNSVTKPVLKLN